VSEWVGRAPEIWTSIKEKFAVLDQPLAAARQLQTALFGASSAPNISAQNVVFPVVAFLTPAAGELLLFFGTLFFFLAGQVELRARFVALFAEREAKLRFLKIMNDIEKNLTGYLVLVTIINATLGAIVALGALLLGLPNPLIFGLLAALLNYVPYVGPAVMVVILFGVGLVTFPSLGHALLAPLGFIALTTAEGHFITPTNCRPADHAQSAAGFSRARLLDVAMGPDRSIPRRAALDRGARCIQSFVSKRGHQTSRLKGTFAVLI
jgi:predicted PurR-regulated permease PerM